MRVVGEDRSSGRAARRCDGPCVAAEREALGIALGGVEPRFLDRGEARRPVGRVEDTQIGFAHRRDVEPFGDGEGPGGAQRHHQLVGVEQAARLKLCAAHLVVGVAHADAAIPHEIAHIPAQRTDSEDAIFQRQLRRIGCEFVDAGVDAGNIAARAFEDVGRQRRKFGVDVAAIKEKSRRFVRRDKSWAESFGHSPHVAAVIHIDLEEPVARDEIALPKKGVVQRRGADVRHAQFVFDHLDRCPRARQPDGPRCAHASRHLGFCHQACRHRDKGGGSQQERTALDQQEPSNIEKAQPTPTLSHLSAARP